MSAQWVRTDVRAAARPGEQSGAAAPRERKGGQGARRRRAVSGDEMHYRASKDKGRAYRQTWWCVPLLHVTQAAPTAADQAAGCEQCALFEDLGRCASVYSDSLS